VEEFMLRERRFGRVGPRPPEMPLHS
jgi:hypothetical protein